MTERAWGQERERKMAEKTTSCWMKNVNFPRRHNRTIEGWCFIVLFSNREDIQIRPGQATVKDNQERAIQIRHLQIITYFVCWRAEMLEKQPGWPISFICRPGKRESLDKMESRTGGEQRLCTHQCQAGGGEGEVGPRAGCWHFPKYCGQIPYPRAKMWGQI